MLCCYPKRNKKPEPRNTNFTVPQSIPGTCFNTSECRTGLFCQRLQELHFNRAIVLTFTAYFQRLGCKRDPSAVATGWGEGGKQRWGEQRVKEATQQKGNVEMIGRVQPINMQYSKVSCRDRRPLIGTCFSTSLK